MAGSRLKRARKQGICLDDGTIIAFPYMPRVADLPRGWRHFSTADKIKHLLGTPLDRALEIVSWRSAELDPLRLSLQVQVLRIVVKIAGKALLDGSLDRQIARERDAALARMVSELSSPLFAPSRMRLMRSAGRMAGIGASRPLPSVPTQVRLLNRLPTLDLGGGDYSSWPQTRPLTSLDG